MVVNEAGKAMVYSEVHDKRTKRQYFDRISFEDLAKLYSNRRVPAGEDKEGNTTYKPAARVWFGSPERRQYLVDGVVFDPSGAQRPGTLNFWRGFAVQPQAGDWSLLRDHIARNICGGDPEHFEYLMGWMARMFQHPAEQGETAVVLRGGEGTGKGTLARVLMGLLGQHALQVSNAKHLGGNFNGHLRDCVFLFADEAFFAGDKQHVGVLKSIITEPYLTIEAKHQNAVQSPNYLHLMMASNEQWVVPASEDARRFFVLEVGEGVKNDHDYFAKLWAQMGAGGYEAMLHDLLAVDLSRFNVRHRCRHGSPARAAQAQPADTGIVVAGRVAARLHHTAVG